MMMMIGLLLKSMSFHHTAANLKFAGGAIVL